jgi:hypothetical protein
MKQLLPLFLFLLPCLALAQYPSNGNQKITLGEQTTADGLIWRGVAADTTLTAKSDTAAYFVLDTVNINLYSYKASATGRKWRQLGADTASIAYVNTYGTQTVNGAKTFTTAPTFSTALGVASGGTGRTTMPDGYILHGDGTSVDTAIGLFWNRTNRRIGINTNFPNVSFEVRQSVSENTFGNGFRITDSNGDKLIRIGHNATSGVIGTTYALTEPYTPLAFQTSDENRLYILANGNIGIGTTSPAVQFHTTSNVRFAGLVNYDPVETDADGDIIDGGASDFNLKNSIEPINYGLNCINQLKPVSYLWNDVNRKLDSTIPDIGFIAQDVMDVIPEAVRSNGDGDLQLNYKAITATLVKAIQEQQALIKALEQRIINLENK